LIFIENPNDQKNYTAFNIPSFTQHQVTGVCLDLAHYTAIKADNKKLSAQVDELIKKFPIGVNHVSGFKASVALKLFKSGQASHVIHSLAELDYLKDLPANYFAKFVCVELENSFLEQREIIQYLELILEDKLK
jgi:hypothetical protein